MMICMVDDPESKKKEYIPINKYKYNRTEWKNTYEYWWNFM